MCADYAAAITTTDERGLNIWFCIDGANKYGKCYGFSRRSQSGSYYDNPSDTCGSRAIRCNASGSAYDVSTARGCNTNLIILGLHGLLQKRILADILGNTNRYMSILLIQ
jgi:hypothetical protein